MLGLQPCHPQEKVFCMFFIKYCNIVMFSDIISYIYIYIYIYIDIDIQVGEPEGFTINLLSTLKLKIGELVSGDHRYKVFYMDLPKHYMIYCRCIILIV